MLGKNYNIYLKNACASGIIVVSGGEKFVDNLIKLLTLLFSQISNPKDLLRNSATLLIGTLIFILVEYHVEIGEYMSNFSSSKIIAEQQLLREAKFPEVATEKAQALYLQTRADAVFVYKYEPTAVNDYQKIIYWESAIPLPKEDYELKPVDKTSNLYMEQLAGINYVVSSPEERVYFKGSDIPAFKNVELSYVYTCPFFNLDNIYSGYIGIAWREIPADKEHMEDLENYLYRVCSTPARALGRAL